MSPVDLKQETVLISGASGLFGQKAAHFFGKRGYRVLSATRRAEADVTFDLGRPEDFGALKYSENVDLFVHAAAAHEVVCRNAPYRSIMENVAGTRAALEFCRTNGIPRFVYLSTFHALGKSSGLIDENTIATPLGDYGLGHLQAEMYVAMYAQLYGLTGLSIRPSNLFGVPTDLTSFKRWSLIPYGFCQEAVQTGRITLKSPGYQFRNFVAIDHVCHEIDRWIWLKDCPKVVHVAGPDTITVRDFAALVARVAGEHLSRTIEVVIPSGGSPEQAFDFRSRYAATADVASESVAEFVRSMVQKLAPK